MLKLHPPKDVSGARPLPFGGRKTRADRRRRALRDFMELEGITPSRLAREAGMKSPNALYNFLSGRSNSLSQETYERLVRSRPGIRMRELTGVE